jgi:dynein assembly factor 5
LPFLYAGLSDETKKLQQYCTEALDKVGEQYEQENIKKVKDEMDYTDGLSDQITRPKVGSRHLARENIQKIIQKIMDGLQDWGMETRFKSCQILYNYLSFAETHVTGYIGVLLPVVYKLLAGDEEIIVLEMLKCMEKIGFYVKPETTLALVLPALKTGGGGESAFRLGCLRTIGGILKGTPILEPQLGLVFEVFNDRDLIQNENCLVLLELAKSMESIGAKLSGDKNINFQYFNILVQLKSVPGHAKITGYTEMQQNVFIINLG